MTTEWKWSNRRSARGLGASNRFAENLLRRAGSAAWALDGNVLVARTKSGVVYNCLVVSEGRPRPEVPMLAAARKALGELEGGECGAAMSTLREAIGVTPPETKAAKP